MKQRDKDLIEQRMQKLMFKMRYWDKEFSTTHMQKSNPLSNLLMMDEMIVDIRSLPPDIQEYIRQKEGRKK
uniref:Uncharacterized protein n=1 Tax=Candidatus Methanophagaceae archaeon ANME-1 ERB6 TaxID=2759912 RepID=A0A7G9YUB6_9EURY|nr:hypothetical protein FJOHDBIG_00049 [Methanosarcinales archaeon ANME-1 ERB6]